MTGFNNLKTAVKLYGGFSLVVVVAVVVAVVGWFNMKAINDGMTRMYKDRLLPSQHLGVAQTQIYKMRGDVYKFILIPKDRTAIEQDIQGDMTEIQRQYDLYQAAAAEQAEQAKRAKFEGEWAAYHTLVTDLLAQIKAGAEAAAISSIQAGGATANARAKVDAALTDLITFNTDTATALNRQSNVTFATAQTTLAMVGGAGVLLGVLLAYLITASFNAPLSVMATALSNLGQGKLNRDLSQRAQGQIAYRTDEIGVAEQGLAQVEQYLLAVAEVAGQIASGDLTVQVTPKGAQDELGQAFAQMVASLRESVGQVAETAANVGAASEQLAAASEQAGSATAQQTEALDKTTHSVEQMKQAIDEVAQGAQEQSAAVNQAAEATAQLMAALSQVAGNAQAVAKDSAAAAAAAKEGAQTVAATVTGMESIRLKVGVSAAKVHEMGQRSNQIGTIVETIEDIASQTNLLALNAAIEAARAGELGQGFAVVADEVRKLAERAGRATKEIGVLVRGIQQTVADAVNAMTEGTAEVETGMERAVTAGETLSNILREAEAVHQQAEAAYTATQRMGEISNALTAAAGAVSAVVEENTASTEKMAAGSGEVTDAIENIASVSEELNAQVEEVAASAGSLSQMALNLQAVVNKFKVNPGGESQRAK